MINCSSFDMEKNICVLFLLVLLCGCSVQQNKQEKSLADYNVVWTTPSENALGSMPVGGGNLQLNTWREKDDLLFYLGSTDSYMDNSSNLGKLGRVRLQFSPNPFTTKFKQELSLEKSEVVFTGDNGFRLIMWVDVFNPVVHVEMRTDIPVEVKAKYETWKLEHTFTDNNQILFYHRNAATNVELEKMIKE